MTNEFIDPTSLSATSSPSPSSCTHEDIDPTHLAGPSRKRIRTQDTTSEDRKEARAHRNRIAAQNSRDRRKAQFSYLERRVVQLEEENRLLRAGAGIPPAEPPAFVPPILPSGHRSQLEEDQVRAEQDRARERENEELKERVRTLERGWDIVLKALAAQGLPTGLSSLSPSVSALPSTPESPATTNVKPNDTNLSSSTAEPSTSIPNTTSGMGSFPSPAPSYSSLESESPPTLAGAVFAVSPSSSSDAVHGTGTKEESKHVSRESTRHLARVASTERPSLVSSVALQRVVSLPAPTLPCRPSSYLPITNDACKTSREDDDDKVMEALFREIVTSPCTAETAESCKVSLAGPNPVAEVIDGCGDETGLDFVETSVRATQIQVREGKEAEDHTIFSDGEIGYSSSEWMNKMDSETERMLDEMIGLVDGGEGGEIGLPCAAAEYFDIGVALGLGMDFDMSTLSGWDIDTAMGCIEAH